jgi:hypothetical protein
MPLPDANKRSPRVYTNLQNLDLDSVSFANIQSTGNPINVEEMNEDEMRRLVLVNLARLVCAGEWTGLLEAGGGGAEFGYKSGYYYQPSLMIWGNTAITEYDANKIYMYPIYINKDVSIDRLAVWPWSGGSVGNCRVGVYNMGSNGLPSTLKFEAGTFTTGGTSTEEFTVSQSLDAGYYWIAFQGDVAPKLRRENDTEGRGNYGVTGFGTSIQNYCELGLRYDLAYSGGFIDLSSTTPNAGDSQQIVSAMRVA